MDKESVLVEFEGHTLPFVKTTTHVAAKMVVQLRQDQFGHRYWFELDLLSRAFLKRENLINEVVVWVQELDVLGEIGVIAVGTAGMVAFQNKSGNVVVVFANEGLASG